MDFLHRLPVKDDVEKSFIDLTVLIEYLDGQAVLTRARRLSLCPRPLRWHPWPVSSSFGSKDRDQSGKEYNVAERFRIEAPIFRLIQEAESVIAGRIKEQVFAPGSFLPGEIRIPGFGMEGGAYQCHRSP